MRIDVQPQELLRTTHVSEKAGIEKSERPEKCPKSQKDLWEV